MKSSERIILSSVLSLGVACAASDESSIAPRAPVPGSTGISQPGAQDFGLFRQILDNGEIPGPEALDALGFFAEHKLDYPAADCGNDLCVHGLLGVMGNFMTGANCTMVQVGMNSPIDVSTLERPPMHLVLAIDVSGSMRGDPIRYVKQGLQDMLQELEPDDRVSIVAYSNEAQVLVETASVAGGSLSGMIEGLVASGSTNIYDGLFQALDLASRNMDSSWQNRVVLLSDGNATAGLTDGARMRDLAAAYAKQGIGVTTIGVGTDFDIELMRDIGEVGAGNFYFLEDPAAAAEVFTEEVKTFLFPVALDVKIDLQVGDGYVLREAIGTKGFEGSATRGRISLPTLFLAGRTEAAMPIEGGRRGGGGAIMLELIPRNDVVNIAEPFNVGRLFVEYTDPRTLERKTQSIEMQNAHLPGETPEEGFFTEVTAEKGFVMLNIFAGFRMASRLAQDGDPGAARGVLQALEEGVSGWLVQNDDPDVADDLKYIRKFEENLAAVPEPTPVTRPAEVWPRD